MCEVEMQLAHSPRVTIANKNNDHVELKYCSNKSSLERFFMKNGGCKIIMEDVG
jgi:hypothetical protein